MGRSGRAGFVGFLIAIGILAYLWTMHSDRGKKAAVYTRATVDTAGVKYDLLTLAKAEHAQFARDARYLSLDQLLEQKDIARTSRPPYTYEAELRDNGFHIVATYHGPERTGWPRSIAIDDKFEFTTEE